MVVAMAMFAVVDAMVKFATLTLPAGQIIVLLGMGTSAFFVTLTKLRGLTLFSRSYAIRPVFLRLFGEVLINLGIVLALANLDLSRLTAIMQFAPIMIALIMVIVYRQRVGWRRWLAIGIGFTGAMIIIRPTSGNLEIGLLFALVALAGQVLRDLGTRSCPPEIPALVLSAHGTLILLPTGAVMMLFATPAPVDMQSLLYMAGAALAMIIAYYAITIAVRSGDISVISLFRYSRILFGVGLGMVLFHERPDAYTYVGSAIVVAAGLYALYRERLALNRKA